MKHFQLEGGAPRCYFATTEDGKPCKLQRKPYTECFYVMALAELYRATGEQSYQVVCSSEWETSVEFVSLAL